MHRLLHLARATEELIRLRYHEDEMRTPMHMSWGQEACAVGLSEGLGEFADFFSTYRSHALFVARTGSPQLLFSEFLARGSSPMGGVAGSMHLSSIANGLFNSSAIVGGNISVAVGSGYASKLSGDGRLSAAVFGDGAIDSGALWESLGLAMLLDVPTLFVCEDNDYAVHATGSELRDWGSGSLQSALEGRGVAYFQDLSGNVHEIVETVRTASLLARETQKPVFIRLLWSRVLEHVGVSSDFDSGWRVEPSAERIERWDPIQISRLHLAKVGIPSDLVDSVEKINHNLVATAYEKARGEAMSLISEIADWEPSE